MVLSSQRILGSNVEKEEIVPDLIKLNPNREDRHLLFMQTMISSQLCGASGDSWGDIWAQSRETPRSPGGREKQHMYLE